MEGVVSWNVDQYALIGVTLCLFGFLGFRRGANRELRSMIGIGLAMLLASVLVPNLGTQINFLHKLGCFALAVTNSDPSSAWQETQLLPDLVQTPEDLQFVSLLVFLGIILLCYLWGQSRIAAPFSLSSKVLGALAGGINGFLVAYYVFPILLKSEAVIRVPGGEINAALGNSRTMALAAVLAVVVLIALGLKASRSPNPRE